MSVSGNPLLLEPVLVVQQALRQMTDRLAETITATLVATLVLGVVVYGAGAGLCRQGAHLLLALDRHSGTLALLFLVADTATAYASALARLRRWHFGWLAVEVDAALRRQALACVLALRALLRLSMIAALIAAACALDPHAVVPSAASLTQLAAALAFAPVLAYHALLTRTPDQLLDARTGSRGGSSTAGPGRLWRWQWAAFAAGWHGGSRRWLLLPLLLVVPADESARVSLALLVVAIVGLLASSAWAAAMRVVVQASAWLRAQPQAAGLQLAALVALPLLMSVLGGALLAAVLASAGLQSVVAVTAGTGAVALGLLHLASVCAWRHEPALIPWRYGLQLAVLFALCQALDTPMAGLLVLPFQLLLLWRRALRLA